MKATPPPLDPLAIVAEVSAAAKRVGMTKRAIRDVAALAIIRADETVSLGEARRIVAKVLSGTSA